MWPEPAVRQEDDVSQLGMICDYAHEGQSSNSQGERRCSRVLPVLSVSQRHYYLVSSLFNPFIKCLLGVCFVPSALGNENTPETKMDQESAPTEVFIEWGQRQKQKVN